jgi:hypothetical protein
VLDVPLVAVLSDLAAGRLSVTYQPEPLKMTGAALTMRRTG